MYMGWNIPRETDLQFYVVFLAFLFEYRFSKELTLATVNTKALYGALTWKGTWNLTS